MIEDWEIGALYWNCLRDCNNNEEEALKKVRMKYEDIFIKEKDLDFFLGTTKQWVDVQYEQTFPSYQMDGVL